MELFTLTLILMYKGMAAIFLVIAILFVVISLFPKLFGSK